MKDCPLFSGHLNKTHQQSTSLVITNILTDTIHQSLWTMHSPVGILGNVLIHTLYTNLSVQHTHLLVSWATSSYTLCIPISLYNPCTHSLTCWYLRQRSHTHSVYQSLCTTHALTHLLVSRATSSHTLCTPISLYNPCTHSPVGISGNVLIHTLYTNLQPSTAILQHVTGTTNTQPVSMCSGKGYYR